MDQGVFCYEKVFSFNAAFTAGFYNFIVLQFIL